MLINDNSYIEILNDIKSRIGEANRNALLSVNKEALNLYWSIGKVINEKSVWGNKFIDNLARDIKLEFPQATGYSVRNLKYMAKYAKMFPDFEIVQVPLAQITWYHTITLMDKTNDKNELLWYASTTAKNGWSRNLLVHQIELDLYKRQALADKVTNFELQLPTPQSELVTQAIKDPYIFEVVSLKQLKDEKDIEKALVQNVTSLLLELGTGFAFIGNQYHLEVGDKDFYVDLLFYNLELRCYVVVELKTGDFDPRDAGQLSFYLTAIDKQLKKETDNPTIGLLLCKNKNNLIAEYALKDLSKPMGVSEYKMITTVPKEFENVLPSADDIKTRIKLD